jgi:hypothetical protein
MIMNTIPKIKSRIVSAIKRILIMLEMVKKLFSLIKSIDNCPIKKFPIKKNEEVEEIKL